MKPFFMSLKLLCIITFVSCASTQNKTMEQEQKINEELSKLNILLRDAAFAITVAATQEAAYYQALGKTVPAFDSGTTGVIKKRVLDEKIATNLAGFYALECGIGVLVDQKGNTPIYWLQKIVGNQLDSSEILLLNRFANATWKAGQPFRAMNRITRENFIVASLLSKEEVQKDYHQVLAAAIKLLDSLKVIANEPAAAQFKKISELMKNKTFALEMAKHMEASYYIALKKPVPLFSSPADDTAIVVKNVFEEKVATNIAGFYALECGLTYLAGIQQKLPSVILQSIIDGTIAKADKLLLERFANATWKAGQPFRSMDRITRDNFTPFYFLSPEEIDKDWVQITSVAKKLVNRL